MINLLISCTLVIGGVTPFNNYDQNASYNLSVITINWTPLSRGIHDKNLHKKLEDLINADLSLMNDDVILN